MTDTNSRLKEVQGVEAAPAPTPTPATSVDAAIAAIEADRQRRAVECERAFQELLKEYRCTFQFVALLFQPNGQFVPQFRITAV